jgi:hypothetical protein
VKALPKKTLRAYAELLPSPVKEAHVIRTWPSKSTPGKVYELIEGADGVVYCTCPAWKFGKRPCRHMKEWEEAVASGGAKFVRKVVS